MIDDYYMIDEYDSLASFDRRSPPVIQEEEEDDPTFGNNKIINFILENSPFDDERITFAVASIAIFVFVSLVKSLFRLTYLKLIILFFIVKICCCKSTRKTSIVYGFPNASAGKYNDLENANYESGVFGKNRASFKLTFLEDSDQSDINEDIPLLESPRSDPPSIPDRDY